MSKPCCCAVLGHSPMRFAWGLDEDDYQCKELKIELLQQIMVLRQQGITQFMVACDPGVGLYAAEAINALGETDGNLMLFCVTPHEEQSTKWAPYLRERYFAMLERCTYLSMVSRHKEPDCQLTAYKRIIDQSDVVLAVYDPASNRGDDADRAIQYALQTNKQIKVIHPDTLQTTILICR